jgi:hypothetical protein
MGNAESVIVQNDTICVVGSEEQATLMIVPELGIAGNHRLRQNNFVGGAGSSPVR